MALPLLHDYALSSACYRVRIGLNLKRLAYARVTVDLLKDEHRAAANRAVNPQGIVPTLEIDGHVIGQSLAILDYLDARDPEPRFVPRDAAARARVLQKMLAVAADIHPVNNLRIRRYLADPLGQDDAAVTEWQCHWMCEGLAALEAMAAADGTAFLSGETPGLADICLVPQLFNARRIELDLASYPELCRIDAALGTIDAFAAAHPDRLTSPAAC
ncbi:MAG: maleylacetoacetate isomerase [Sphingomonadaceae bacterium]|nr:maleylacetoacetate isomerase [Sphingomonadaceae bacterium]